MVAVLWAAQAICAFHRRSVVVAETPWRQEPVLAINESALLRASIKLETKLALLLPKSDTRTSQDWPGRSPEA